MKKFISLLILLIMNLNICSCGAKTVQVDTEPVKTVSGAVSQPEIKAEENIKEATILAAGDIMFHMPVLAGSRSDNGYDFTNTFSDIKPLIDSADIAIGNFETTIYPGRKLSGFPRFNSPPEVLGGIKYAGFDVLTTANNHCADSGKDGIISTVKYIKNYGFIPVGTGEIGDKKYAVIEKNGIRVGILSYTFSTNGLPVPKGMVNLIDKAAIKSDIDNIKKMCDYAVVCLHTGMEYKRDIEPSQQKLFYEIADMGADCIFGGHPHVARGSEIYNSKGRRVFIVYSLGNFISSQNDRYTDIGVVAKIKLRKDDSGLRLAESNIIPVFIMRCRKNNKNNFKVVECRAVDSYTEVPEEKKVYIKEAYNNIMNKSITAIYKEEIIRGHRNGDKRDS